MQVCKSNTNEQATASLPARSGIVAALDRRRSTAPLSYPRNNLEKEWPRRGEHPGVRDQTSAIPWDFAAMCAVVQENVTLVMQESGRLRSKNGTNERTVLLAFGKPLASAKQAGSLVHCYA